jgi:biotin carboxyl carrier protein
VQYEVEINGRTRHVSVTRTGDGFDVVVDGRTFPVDAARLDGQTLSVLVGTASTASAPVAASGTSRAGDAIGSRRSFEVTVAPDVSGGFAVGVGTNRIAAALNGRRRWGRRGEEAHAGVGPQRIVAPMPGKIVRVLVKTGESVRARQAVVVVEAMKMENELRATGDGTVAAIHAQEGASVEAGALLVVIQ